MAHARDHVRAEDGGPVELYGGLVQDWPWGSLLPIGARQQRRATKNRIYVDGTTHWVQWGSATKNTMGYLKTGTSSDPGKVAFLGSFWEDFPGSSLNLGHGFGKSH